jgi:L-malate glycosyltransferase
MHVVSRPAHQSGWTVDTGPVHQARTVKVMHVMFALQPGGMELGVVKVVNGLNPQRVTSSICSTRPAVPGVKALVSPAVPVFELQRRDGNDPRLVRDLYRLFRREQPDIVHTHAWGTLVEGIVAARLARVPVVVHGEHGTLQLRWYQRTLQRWVWGMATQVLSVSRKLTDRMTATTGFAAERILTIQNGVDLARFSPSLRDAGREALGISPDTLVIGTAGRLVPVKDHANLIDALGRLRTRGVRFTALIAGDGPLRRALEEQIASLAMSGCVHLLGPRPDIDRVMASLDIFVLPSRSEGMSNTILEAMASGVPVVATNVGGAEELVDDGRTGRLVPREDPAALSVALTELANDPDRRRGMGLAALQKAGIEFSLARMLRDYETLYVDLAARGRASGVAST